MLFQDFKTETEKNFYNINEIAEMAATVTDYASLATNAKKYLKDQADLETKFEQCVRANGVEFDAPC